MKQFKDDRNIIIRIDGVYKYFAEKIILNNINLEIYKGEILAIMGMSGSGKSTLLKQMLGIICPDKGKIYLFGEDIYNLSTARFDYIRKKCGMIFQFGALFDSMTVFNNVSLPLIEHTKYDKYLITTIVKNKLELVGLEGFENFFPNQLSGGMKKRVALARAIALEPEIVIYDEPTTGLDPMASVSIYELIQDMEKRLKITSIIITHDVPNVFAVANRIAVLHEGKIIACDTPENIVKLDKPEIQAFLKTQMKFKL